MRISPCKPLIKIIYVKVFSALMGHTLHPCIIEVINLSSAPYNSKPLLTPNLQYLILVFSMHQQSYSTRLTCAPNHEKMTFILKLGQHAACFYDSLLATQISEGVTT